MKFFKNLFSEMGSVYPSYHPANPAAAFKLYEKHLSGFTEAELRLAANEIMITNKWFPSIAEFVSAAMKARVSGTAQADHSGAERIRFLQREQDLIERASCRDYDQAEWHELLDDLLAAGRLCAADSIRRRMAALTPIYAAKAGAI